LSLTTCLKKAGDALSRADRTAILDQTQRNRAAGMPAKAAAAQALETLIADAQARVLNQGEQRGEQPPRAQVSFGPDISLTPSVISLMKGADLSSFVHESAHLFLEIQGDIVRRIQQQAASGASITDQERGLIEDMGRLLDWFGVKGSPEVSALDTWAMMSLEERREMHEKFARGFEAYAMEGKAPSIDLQDLFTRFRSWLVQVYKTLRGLNVELTDDVRAVMGRMIATDQAIEEAEAQRSMGPLFRTAEQAGMTLEQFNAYQALAGQATEAAQQNLQERVMRDMKWLSRARDRAIKAKQKEAEELRREVRAAVRIEVYSEPVYRAWAALTGKPSFAMEASAAESESKAQRDAWAASRVEAEAAARQRLRDELYAANPEVRGLAKGQLLAKNKRQIDIDVQQQMLEWDKANPQPARAPRELEDVELGTFGKLDADEVAQSSAGAAAILAARGMTTKQGADPEMLADAFEFDSGDALVQALAAAVPPKEVIEARTDQRMLELYGDINSPEALDRAADEAVHNEARARFIAAELKALEQANSVRQDTGRKNTRGQPITVDVMARAAKDYAQQIVGRLKVRDIRPAKYTGAEARSAKLAQKAVAAAKLDEAAMHKRNQLVNNYAAKAAMDAQAEVARVVKYLRKFDKPVKSLDRGYQDQIDQLLERVELKPITLREVDRRKSFAEWIADQQAQGIEPEVPDNLLNEAGRTSYKDMTVEELRGLVDTIKQIEHLGRLKNKLLLAKNKREVDAITADMVKAIEATGTARPVRLEDPKGVRAVVPWLEGVWASHRKLSSLFRQMDGRDDGPLYEYIGRTMNEQGAAEDVMVEKAAVELDRLYAPVLKLRGGLAGSRSKVFIPEINASLTRGGRLAVALNWGNDVNRQRLRDGDRWTDAQVAAILRTLTPTELEFVNGMWAYLDSYWPEVSAKEKRVTGVSPDKVEAQPFVLTAADGTEVPMRGGYYPLKYDAERSDRTDQQDAQQIAKEMMQGVTTRATTRRGHTKQRVEDVKRPVRKDLSVITQHITQVVHDLAWHEWLIDTNKLLRDDGVVEAIRSNYGPAVLKTIRDGVQGIATADVKPQTDIDKALLLLRSNVTRATMGASITTAFLQPFGLTQSVVRIGGKHVLRGVARWGGDAARMESTIGWIRGKSEFMRLRSKTFNRELREIQGRVGGKSKAMVAVDGGLFWMMQKMQLVADVPTWVGQYEKTMAEGPKADTDDARAELEARAVADADRAVIEAQGGGSIKDLAEVQRKHPMLTQFYSYFSVTLNLTAERTAATDFKNPRAVAGWLGDMALLLAIPAILPALILATLRGGDDDDESMAEKVAKWQAGYLLGLVVGVRELSGALGGFDYAGPPVGRIVGDIGKAGQQTAQGEVDDAAVLAYARLIGTAFGIPVTQIIRSYKGWKAWDEGEEGAGAQSVLLGPPAK
jgi:hypothetical protein